MGVGTWVEVEREMEVVEMAAAMMVGEALVEAWVVVARVAAVVETVVARWVGVVMVMDELEMVVAGSVAV